MAAAFLLADGKIQVPRKMVKKIRLGSLDFSSPLPWHRDTSFPSPIVLSLSLNSVPQLPLVLPWMDPGLGARRLLEEEMESPLKCPVLGTGERIPTTTLPCLRGRDLQ